MEQLEKHSLKIALLIILFAGIIVRMSFLNENEYRTTVDEGNYYRQAKILTTDGFSGYKRIADDWIGTPKLHETPNPLRVVNTSVNAVFISIDDSYHSLTYLCLLCYLGFLIGTYFFANRYWGWQVALITVTLLAFSPIQMAMARRALMDGPATAIAAFAFFAFWRMVETGKQLHIAAFVTLMVAAILVKEIACLLLPFLGLVLLWQRYRKESGMSWPAVFISMGLPVLIVVAIYLTVLGSDRVMLILQIIHQPTPYGEIWNKGPWYRYVVDFLSLSPFVLLLAIGFIGYVIAQAEVPRRTIFMIFFLGYLLFMYSWLPKNIRYGMLFDLPLCLFAASMLLLLFNRWQQLQWLPAIVMLVMVAFGCWSFYKYFIDKNIYDPLSYSLLTANRIIPDYRDVSPNTSYEVKQTVAEAEQVVKYKPTADNYSQLALNYYQEGKYKEAVETYKEILKLKPNDAVTYNNICSAYNAMKDWPNAIAACNESIRLDSTLTRAKKNLQWAIDQQAKGEK